MKKHLLSLMVMCMAFICATPASAAITKEYGWFESAAVEWEAVSGATDYNVYEAKLWRHRLSPLRLTTVQVSPMLVCLAVSVHTRTTVR